MKNHGGCNLRPARKCGAVRVGGTPGKTSGDYEEVNSIVMSETGVVKSFSGFEVSYRLVVG